MTKEKKFIIRQPDGVLRAKVSLTKAGTKLWRAKNTDNKEEIMKTIGDAAKVVLKLDEVFVCEVLNS